MPNQTNNQIYQIFRNITMRLVNIGYLSRLRIHRLYTRGNSIDEFHNVRNEKIQI